MALLGFETWATIGSTTDTLLTGKYLTGSTATVSSPGRLGLGYYLSGGVLAAPVTGTPTTIIIELGCRTTSASTSVLQMVTVEDSVGAAVFTIRSRGTGTPDEFKYEVTVDDGTAGDAVFASTTALALGGDNWHWLQVEVTIDTDSTVGTCSIKVDNEAEQTFSGAATSASGTTANYIEITGSGNAGIGVIVWKDTTGAAPHNDFYARGCVGGGKFPSGAGANNDWANQSGTSSANNYLSVDDGFSFIDGDTSYVSTADNGDTDDYAFTATDMDLTASDTILGVQICAQGRLESGGSGNQDFIFVHDNGAAVTTSFGTAHTLSNTTDYDGFFEVESVDPATAAAWTLANLDTNYTYGFQLTA